MYFTTTALVGRPKKRAHVRSSTGAAQYSCEYYKLYTVHASEGDQSFLRDEFRAIFLALKNTFVSRDHHVTSTL